MVIKLSIKLYLLTSFKQMNTQNKIKLDFFKWDGLMVKHIEQIGFESKYFWPTSSQSSVCQIRLDDIPFLWKQIDQLQLWLQYLNFTGE